MTWIGDDGCDYDRSDEKKKRGIICNVDIYEDKMESCVMAIRQQWLWYWRMSIGSLINKMLQDWFNKYENVKYAHALK